jgi:REP element-mobilizing transposase RayT
MYLMSINFQPFRQELPVRSHRRHLPHWRQDGATYFVTFREHDSLPAPLVLQLNQLRDALLAHADDRALYLEADRAYFQKMKHFLNAGHGACLLRDRRAADVVHKAMAHFAGDRYELGETKVMANHVHALVKPLPGYELDDILQGWKSYTAHRINKLLGLTGTLWQSESYDRLVRDSTELARTERYIRSN